MATPADSPVNPITDTPDLVRLLAAARRSLERTGGDLNRTIGLTQLTDAERRAVGGLLGRHIAPGTKRVEINLDQVDTRLRALSGHGLAETLGRDKPLRDRPAEAARDKAARERLLAIAHTSPLYHQDWFTAWIEEIRGNGTFTRLLKTPARLSHAVAALELIDTLNSSTVTLPKLATRATGHSHALDHRTPLSALVLDALASRTSAPRPTTTEQRRELWDQFNVIVDDLASTVLVLNLPATGAGLGDWLTSAAATATPFHITLHQILTHPLHLAPQSVHVCENPAVLREASDILGPACPSLICTQGQPSTAFHRLATKITSNGGQLRYHGDFDWPGITMTAAMANRHNAQPWRMTTADYTNAVNHTLNDDEPTIGGLKGDPEPTPWDPPLSDTMIRLNRAIYEEAVVDVLIADLGDLQ
jgi:uncharacterized protein (TIGR02679 family)